MSDCSSRQNKRGTTNGIAPTLKYYLRLLADAGAFVDAYVAHLESAPAVTYALKEAWNQLGDAAAVH